MQYVYHDKNTINIHEIISVIYSLTSFEAGYDEISASIMKQLGNVYVEPLTHLINQSISQGLFPEEMKLAKILPIYKSEDEQLVTNYRPISILHFFLNHFKNYIYIYIFMDENNISDRKHITHGVPQGSILGHLLFIIYINDFSRASDLLFSILFTDDTSVFTDGTSYNNVIDVLNQELKRVDLWLKANKLTINLKKRII